MTTLTKSERLARQRLIYHLWRADGEDTLPLHRLAEEAPEAWHMIEADIDCHEPKVKMTLYLDVSVAKLFRTMGKGYQARINRILATWLAMKMGGLMEEVPALAARRARALAAEQETGTRPGWGSHVGED